MGNLLVTHANAWPATIPGNHVSNSIEAIGGDLAAGRTTPDLDDRIEALYTRRTNAFIAYYKDVEGKV